MNRQLKALDLFCGGGGAGMGLHMAGYTVTGIDIEPQPRYPFEFIQADVFNSGVDWNEFDLIWASPVCKRFSSATRTAGTQDNHPDQIDAIREMLIAVGRPYIIENVAGAPLENSVMLCGSMFGLKTYRHRYFESNMELRTPEHPLHTNKVSKMGRAPKGDEFINPVGHFSDVKAGQEALGIDWLGQAGLSQAIPPAYSYYLGVICKEFAYMM